MNIFVLLSIQNFVKNFRLLKHLEYKNKGYLTCQARHKHDDSQQSSHTSRPCP